MIKYIQELLPRIKNFSSQLDKKELFVDKLFTLLQPNNEVHQYTFNRDKRLILSINGFTTLGSWELLATGQLLINRGKDIITLDFDFLHPDVLIMKMGGTADNPFIIYDKNVISDGNVLKYLKMFEAEKRGEKIFLLPNITILESEVNKKIFDENGKPYHGETTSSPYKYYKYPYKVEDIKIVRSGIVVEKYYDVKYLYSGVDETIVIRQKDLDVISLGDKIVLEKSFPGLNNVIETKLNLDNTVFYLDENYSIIEISIDDFSFYLPLVVFSGIFILFISIVIFLKGLLH